MGFFSDAFQAVGDFFGGDDVASSLIDAGASLGGAFISSQANEAAADRVAQAEEERARATERASLRADRRFQEQRDLAAPGTERLRDIVVNPQGLTPEQQRGLEDARREANATLAASGLRGSGRAVTAALKDIDENFRARAIESNIGRADRAASQLSGEGFRAGEQAINTGLRGDIGASEARTSGEFNRARAGIANAGLRGAALGDISSIISDQIKARGRQGRYGDKKDSEKEVV